MEVDRYRATKDLMLRALELPEAERDGFLREAAGDDAELLAEVRSLLGYAVVPSLDLGPVLPETIGRYRVIREIGSGGMGRVFEAEQDVPRRRVALKVIRGAMAAPALVRRFELEARILARLEHPGIARIYDAGAAEGSDPTPFLVMELVDGVELGRWLEVARPDRGRRLEVVARLAEAIAYAHTQAVIHRDLKPSNVMVGRDDQPKVLDFGIARALDDDRAGTLLTRSGEMLGTLAYMSPEQVMGRTADVRSDVYALGMIAYEMLAGALPHDLHGLSFAAASQRILTGAPRPLGAHDRTLRGDLETVVHKAIAFEPGARYQTAEAFADDLRRVLAGDAVFARPHSAAYRLRRFVGRNRVLVGAAVIVMVSLAAVIVMVSLAAATAVSLERARAAERERVTAERERVTAERARLTAERERVAAENARVDAEAARTDAEAARVEAERARAAAETALATAESERDGRERLLEYLLAMLRTANPLELGARATVGDLLIRAQAAADTRFADRPELGSRLSGELGAVWLSFGDVARARACFETAVDMLRRNGGPADQLAAALSTLADCVRGLGDPHAALPLVREALAILDGLEPPPPGAIGATRGHEAAILLELGDFDGARASCREGIAALDAETGSDATVIALLYGRLANAEMRSRNPEAGYAAARRAVDILVVRDSRDRYDLTGLLQTLAWTAAYTGRADEARAASDEAVAIWRALVDGDHPELSVALVNHGTMLRVLGDHEASERWFRDGVAMAERDPRTPPNLLEDNRRSLGDLLLDLRRGADAVPVWQAIVAASRARHGDDPGQDATIALAMALSSLGASHALAGEVAAALDCHREARGLFGDALGGGAAPAVEHGWLVVTGLGVLGRDAELRPELEGLLDLGLSPSTLGDAVEAAENLSARGRPIAGEVAAALGSTLALSDAGGALADDQRCAALLRLAAVLETQARAADAVAALEAALAIAPEAERSSIRARLATLRGGAR